MTLHSIDSSLQNAPTSVFAQIIELLPKNLIQSYLEEKCPKHNATKYGAWDHFIALLFCHLGGCDSLREIDDGLYAAYGKLNHVDAQAMKRTTLAYANEKRPYSIFEDIYYFLLDHFKSSLGLKRLGKSFKKPVYSLDSTTISVCISRFDWAKYQTRKGGIKLHTIISNDILLPQVISMTDARSSDVKLARSTIEKLPAEQVTVVMDRGYNDYDLFSWLTERGTSFVTRLRDDAVTSRLKDDVLDEGEGYGDYRFSFTSNTGKKLCGDKKFRLVQWHDETYDRWFDFITNDFDLTAEQVATLYKDRWQIELFFKKIKQNLKIKSFIGTNVNAVMSQIWTAAIVTLLVEVLRRKASYPWTFPRLLHFLRLNLLTHKKLSNWIHYPDLRPLKDKSSEKPPEENPQMDLNLQGGAYYRTDQALTTTNQGG